MWDYLLMRSIKRIEPTTKVGVLNWGAKDGSETREKAGGAMGASWQEYKWGEVCKELLQGMQGGFGPLPMLFRTSEEEWDWISLHRHFSWADVMSLSSWDVSLGGGGAIDVWDDNSWEGEQAVVLRVSCATRQVQGDVYGCKWSWKFRRNLGTLEVWRLGLGPVEGCSVLSHIEI